MRQYITIIRRAFGRAFQGTAGLYGAGRWLLALATTASALVGVLGPVSPAHAVGPPDPAARLQIVIKSIHVYDDRDLFGSGEMEWFAVLCPGDVVHQCTTFASYVRGGGTFSASSGQTVPLERVLPLEGDTAVGDATVALGMPVYAGTSYMFRFNIGEDDPGGGDNMGDVIAAVDAEHGWGIGTFTAYATHGDEDAVDYVMTYEIRRTPLPDLKVYRFETVDGPEGPAYCGHIENAGETRAESVPLLILLETTPVGDFELGPLEAGQTAEKCYPQIYIPPADRTLNYSLDVQHVIPEMDETNNIYVFELPARTPASPTPTLKPTGAKIDAPGPRAALTVRAIKVNGQVPDGKDDCKAGKNGVTVTVKNTGDADAGSFAVHLAVDDGDTSTTVDTLRAGQEREVRLDNVQMKKGDHKLTASVDGPGAASHDDASNATRTVSATCKDGE